MRSSKWFLTGIFSFSLLSLSSCSFSRDKVSTPALNTSGVDRSFFDSNGNLLLPAGKVPGYNTLNQLIFTPRCAECHMNGQSKGDMSLGSYASAKSSMKQIYQAASVDRSMPVGGTLSAVEQSFVTAWYDAGGPENDMSTGGGPLPKPACTPAPGVSASFYDSNCNPVLPVGIYPGYNSLKALVLADNCLQCHSKTAAKKTVLDDYAHAKAVYSDIGKAIFQGNYMPPSGKLGANERALIAAWYEADGP
jgi:mono/diheme cytochrome c family protein